MLTVEFVGYYPSLRSKPSNMNKESILGITKNSWKLNQIKSETLEINSTKREEEILELCLGVEHCVSEMCNNSGVGQ
jgi:hypothetical protein